jgi:phage gp16-like protein
MINKAQIALIHVAKAKTGMTEDEYRGMLSGFGAASSKELNRPQFDAVMRHFKKLGFSRRPVQAAGPDPQSIASSQDRLKKKVQAFAREMHLTRAYLDAISVRMFGVDAWIWLDADQLTKLVAALSYHQQRNRKRNLQAAG